MSENPTSGSSPGQHDVLSTLLSTIRLSGSLQFCFMPTGAWQTDAAPSLAKLSPTPTGTMPLHVVVDGSCWLKIEGEETALEAGDVVVFPFATGHQLGAGENGRLVIPTRDLPAKPWREIPVLRYGDDAHQVRLLCGYLQCDALDFAPLRRSLPKLIHVRTRFANDGDWLRSAIRQMVAEVDRPRAGGISMLPRLTEIVFIEILRQQILTAAPASVSWLAALADPLLSRCLALIHEDPKRDWSLEALSAAAATSRSTLAERFRATLGTSPIKYLRAWRLYLAKIALSTERRAIAAVAYEAGYSTEAAFNRAFAKAHGKPPAAWRAAAQA